MCDGAPSDIRAEFGDTVERRRGIGTVQPGLGLPGDAVEVLVIPLEQFHQDRFLGFEMVVQAARQNAGRIRDLLQRRTEARRGDQRGSGLEDLGPARAILSSGAGVDGATWGCA